MMSVAMRMSEKAETGISSNAGKFCAIPLVKALMAALNSGETSMPKLKSKIVPSPCANRNTRRVMKAGEYLCQFMV